MRTRIKVCGIDSEDLAMLAADAGADALGFVLQEGKPGFIDPDEAFDLTAVLPPFIATVGVWEHPDMEEFSDAEEACPTILTQLSGKEDAKTVKAAGPDVIKTLPYTADAAALAKALAPWAAMEEVSALLIRISPTDTPDWVALAQLIDTTPKPIILGGIEDPATLETAVRLTRPYGVDLAGGDIEALCAAVRRADAAAG